MTGHGERNGEAATAPEEADSGGPGETSGARWVALGILASRLVGVLRERAFAYFFGVGPHTDVLKAAFRGPNLLQNLLGEGTLSAAFIPIYSRLLNEGRERDAGRFAGAVFSFLLALAALLSLAGILFARPLVAVFSPGFLDDASRVAAGELSIDRYQLAVTAVKILFPMTGILVLSAWALGVLNSHRRFLLPYLAPVLWNLAILGVLFGAASLLVVGLFEGDALGEVSAVTRNRLVVAVCLGALLGGALQFLVQLPLVIKVLTGFRFSWSLQVEGVREALSAFGPVVAGRGVYQISGWLDVLLASLLAVGALAALGFALQLYVLPVSLFGLSVAAAELPELSRLKGEDRRLFVDRLRSSLPQMGFFIVPTAVGYVLFGWLLVGALFRTGEFGVQDQALVALVLAGYALGLPATTPSRLLQNAFFALSDAKTPARVAVVRVAVSVTVAVPAMFFLDRYTLDLLPWVSVPVDGTARLLHLGALGLALGSAVGSWVELAALLRKLEDRLPEVALPWRALGRQGGLALAAALPAAGSWWLLESRWPQLHPIVDALMVVGLYAGVYLLGAHLGGISQLGAWLRGRRGGRGRRC